MSVIDIWGFPILILIFFLLNTFMHQKGFHRGMAWDGWRRHLIFSLHRWLLVWVDRSVFFFFFLPGEYTAR
jgi:hypothetical protein